MILKQLPEALLLAANVYKMVNQLEEALDRETTILCPLQVSVEERDKARMSRGRPRNGSWKHRRSSRTWENGVCAELTLTHFRRQQGNAVYYCRKDSLKVRARPSRGPLCLSGLTSCLKNSCHAVLLRLAQVLHSMAKIHIAKQEPAEAARV